jgi:RNA polymerase sigma-70 factor (ECF subfamily)
MSKLPSRRQLRAALQAAREGRNLSEAAEVFDRAYRGSVGRWLPHWLPETEREDLTQEVLHRVYRWHEGLPARIEAVEPHLRRIAMAAAVDWLRKHRRTEPWDPLRHREPADMTSPTPERYAAARELWNTLERALRALPPRQRQVACLRLREKSGAEIGAILGIPVDTVKSNLDHARRRLRELLQTVEIDLSILDQEETGGSRRRGGER